MNRCADSQGVLIAIKSMGSEGAEAQAKLGLLDLTPGDIMTLNPALYQLLNNHLTHSLLIYNAIQGLSLQFTR